MPVLTFIEQIYDHEEATRVLGVMMDNCPYLLEHDECTGCGCKPDCEKIWDGFAGSTMDKNIMESQIQKFKVKKDKLQPAFML